MLRQNEPIREEVLVDFLYRAQVQAEPAAFDGLYGLYADRIYSFIGSRVNDHELAEDLTAQVFLHLIEKVTAYDIATQENVAIFSAWLFRIARNKLADFARERRRVQLVALEYADSVASSRNIEELEERINLEALLDKLTHLEDDQRNVIVLRYIADYSIAETAEIMHKSESAVKSLRFRALENLRRHLQAW
ncbi:MAG: RNA polymerase sigma factor [Caldilineaceae bacterium]